MFKSSLSAKDKEIQRFKRERNENKYVSTLSVSIEIDAVKAVIEKNLVLQSRMKIEQN